MSFEQPSPSRTSTAALGARRYAIRVGLPCAGLALLGVGYLLGKSGQPPASTGASVCAQASTAAQGFNAQAENAPTGFAGGHGNDFWVAVEEDANVVLQNSECFSPADRATAQVALDNARRQLSGQ